MQLSIWIYLYIIEIILLNKADTSVHHRARWWGSEWPSSTMFHPSGLPAALEKFLNCLEKHLPQAPAPEAPEAPGDANDWFVNLQLDATPKMETGGDTGDTLKPCGRYRNSFSLFGASLQLFWIAAIAATIAIESVGWL